MWVAGAASCPKPWRRAGATVTGIDLGDKPLKVAQMHLLESGLAVEYRKITVEDLADEQPGQYDVVTCMEMLEHVPDPASTVQACARLVKPGGRCFFSTINRNPKSYLVCHSRRRIRAEPAAARHARLRADSSRPRNWRVIAAARNSLPSI